MPPKTSILTDFPQEFLNPKDLLIHYGEIALKGKNRHLFERKLMDNLSAKLGGYGLRRIRKLSGRMIASFEQPYLWSSLCGTFKEVIGISSASPVWIAPPDLAKLEETVSKVVEGRKFTTFAVRTRRGEKFFPYTSQQVNIKIGDLVRKKTGAKVDLENPMQTIWIEIMNREILISLDRVKGAPGLPVGVSGRVLSLLSGGIDSPVAAWRMMKRGCEITFLHFHSSPFTSVDSQEKAIELAESLSKFQQKTRLALVPLGPIQGKIVTNTPEQYRVILYRRFMMRIAEAIAKELKARAIVTGESLGQVSSQTLSNIATVESAATIPILRPLIGMDKEEITKNAREIGTYDISIKPHPDCCSFLQPRHPVLKTTPKELDEIEIGLNINDMVREAVNSAVWKDISGCHSRESGNPVHLKKLDSCLKQE